jgi:hypothetical protein
VQSRLFYELANRASSLDHECSFLRRELASQADLVDREYRAAASFTDADIPY